jgi:hypothetical protein
LEAQGRAPGKSLFDQLVSEAWLLTNGVKYAQQKPQMAPAFQLKLQIETERLLLLKSLQDMCPLWKL